MFKGPESLLVGPKSYKYGKKTYIIWNIPYGHQGYFKLADIHIYLLSTGGKWVICWASQWINECLV